MTEPSSATIYPRYCFHLSPTFNAWCFFNISDIHALDQHDGFKGEGFHFYRNLPIKWVRVVGLIVAIDEYAGRRIYTVDDSSGACIEAVCALPTADKDKINQPKTVVPVIPDGATVGSVVDVKGSLSEFRSEKQIKVERFSCLRDTTQEVALWEKRAKFSQEVLKKPWVLHEKDIRRCRKETERSSEGKQKGKRKSSTTMTSKAFASKRPTTATELKSSKSAAPYKRSLNHDSESGFGKRRISRGANRKDTLAAAIKQIREEKPDGAYSALGL